MFGASARAPPSPFVAQQGWLVKQGGTRKTWRKRWFVLTDGVLRWYEPGWFTLNPVDGLLKGELDITGGSVSLCSKEECGSSGPALRIVAPGVRSLYACPASAAEQEAWLAALRRACSGSGGGGSSSSSSSSAAHAGAGVGAAGSSLGAAAEGPAAWRGNLCGEGLGAATVGVALEGFFESSNWGGDAFDGGGSSSSGGGSGRRTRMPVLVDIDGTASVGSELRVRGAHLESLCMAWFTLGAAAAAPELDLQGDISLAPGFALIPGAKAQTWVVEGKYVGCRVGCLVRPAVGGGGRWGLLLGSVAQPDPHAPSLRLCPQPHQHKKYCDRRVRVCTAVGRYREGEVLCAVASESLLAAAGQWRYAWYRSAPLLDLHPPGSAGSSAAGSAGAPRDRSALALQAASRHGVGRRVTELEYTLVQPRPVEDLPPSPLDYQPSPTSEEIARALAPKAAGAAPACGCPQAPLFCEDVGCMYVCLALRCGEGGSGAAPPPRSIVPASLAAGQAAGGSGAVVLALSQAVGPIEPAPPRAREIWIAGATGAGGAPAVGNLLQGCVYYYGGWEGRSSVSWVAIGSDGETREVKACAPSPSPDVAPLPGAGSGSAGDAHPRALRVTEDLLGCILKFKVQPVRWDGDEGHQESSRPTAEVVRA